MQEKREFAFEPQENENIIAAALLRFGNSAVLTELNGNILVYFYDSDGNQTRSVNFGGLFEGEFRYAELLGGENECYVNFNCEQLFYIDPEDNALEIDVKNQRICGLTNDKDGKPCAVLSDDDKGETLVYLSGKEFSEEMNCSGLGNYYRAIGQGFGSTLVTAVTLDGLFSFDGSAWTKLSSFEDSDFNVGDIYDVMAVGENEFVLMLKTNSIKPEMRLLSQRDISEIKQKETIRILKGFHASEKYDQTMRRFNAENEKYRVEVVEYPDDDDYRQLKMDIAAGKGPDIISTRAIESPDVYADLYPLMENDPDINRDKFIDGYLEAMEVDGKLLEVSSTFSINTIAVKDKFLNGMTSWNYEQFANAYKNLPEGMIFSQRGIDGSRTDVFLDFVDLTEFIDKENGTCSFDSPEFINILRIFGENKIGRDERDYDGDSMTAEYIIQNYRNDKALALPWYIFDYNDMQTILRAWFGEPTTLIGYPTNSGFGTSSTRGNTYGIVANSKNIEGAWEFLKYWLFDYENPDKLWGFPTIEEEYLKQLQSVQELYLDIDPITGEETRRKRLYCIEADPVNPENSKTVEMDPFTKEEAEVLDKIVREALKKTGGVDENVRNIFYDELPPFFNGERTAEKTAQIIQNRVSIYISERS